MAGIPESWNICERGNCETSMKSWHSPGDRTNKGGGDVENGGRGESHSHKPCNCYGEGKRGRRSETRRFWENGLNFSILCWKTNKKFREVFSTFSR